MLYGITYMYLDQRLSLGSKRDQRPTALASKTICFFKLHTKCETAIIYVKVGVHYEINTMAFLFNPRYQVVYYI